MSRRQMLVAILTSLMLMTMLVGAVGAEGNGGPKQHVLVTQLSGANEIGPDGKPNAGDPDGRGVAVITLKESQVCFLIVVRKIDNVVGGHIHKGAEGANGPVNVNFDLTQAKFRHGVASGCVSASAEMIHAIHHDPSAYYVNVHTTPYPRGAVRGQLTPRGHGHHGHHHD